MTIGAPTFGAIVRGVNGITPVAPAFTAGQTVIVFTGQHYGTNVLSGAPASPWQEATVDVNAQQLRAFALYSTTGSEAMPTLNWGGSDPGWAVVAVVPGIDPGLATGYGGGDRSVNHVSSIFGPASARTPSVPGCISFFFGAKNKTTTSNGATFSPPSGFTLGFQDVPNGSSNVAVGIAYQIQTTIQTIAANEVLVGSISDGSVQTSQGSLFCFQPAPSTSAIAGTASAGASASGTLTSGIAGAATASAAAAAGLTTAIRAAAAASVGSAVVGALTNWTTVVLSGAQYTGPGGLHDATLQAQGFDPSVGTTILYDASKVTCYSNGEISAITNDCSFVAQYFDGTTWRTAIVVISPQLVTYANVTAAATGSLTTAIRMASAAVALSASNAQLSSAIVLASSALAVAQASGAMLTSIHLNAAALGGASATGNLSGGQASLQGAASVLTSALASLTAKIQLAAQISANSVVAGALSTQVMLSGAANALTQAAAQITVGVQLAGNAVVSTSATGASLIVTNFAGAANAVASAAGALLAGLRFAADAAAQASGAGNLATGIPLAGAAEADTIAALRPVGNEGQFGYAQINILSPTGLPVDLSTFIAGSACIVQISYFNSLGAPFVPTRVQYAVIDILSGSTIVPYTDIPQPDLADAVTLSGVNNLMVSNSRDSEQHRILFKITDAVSTISYASAIFEIDAVPGILN